MLKILGMEAGQQGGALPAPTGLQQLAVGLIAIVALVSVLARYFFHMEYVPAFRSTLIDVQLTLTLLCLVALRGRVPVPSAGVGLLLLTVWLALSSWATIDSDFFFRAVTRQLEVVLSLLNLWLLGHCLRRFPQLLPWLTTAVILAISWSWWDELQLFLQLDYPFLHRWAEGGSRNYLHIRHWGDAASIGVVLSAWLTVQHTRMWRLSGYVAMVMSVTAVLFSAGRGSCFATLLALIAIGWMNRERHWYIVKMVLAVAVGGLLAVWMTPDAAAAPGFSGWPGIWRMFGAFARVGEGENFSSGRDVIWSTSLALTQSMPWFGKGPDTYVYITPFMYGQTPHNTLLQFVLDWGWPAGLIGFGFLVWMSWKAWLIIWRYGFRRLSSGQAAAAYWAAAFGIFMFHGLVATTFYEPVDMFLAMAMLAVIFSIQPESKAAMEAEPEVSSMSTANTLTLAAIGLLLVTIVWVNQQYARALSLNQTLSLGEDIPLSDQQWLAQHPYQLASVYSVLVRGGSFNGLQGMALADWLEPRIEYRATQVMAWKSLWHAQQGNQAESDAEFERALANVALISKSASIRSVCHTSGRMESAPECAASLRYLEWRSDSRRWYRRLGYGI